MATGSIKQVNTNTAGSARFNPYGAEKTARRLYEKATGTGPNAEAQKPEEPDTSWMQNIFTPPGQSRGRTTAAPAVTPVQTPELDAAVGNTPGTTGQVGFGVGADAGNTFWDNMNAALSVNGHSFAEYNPVAIASKEGQAQGTWDKSLPWHENIGNTLTNDFARLANAVSGGIDQAWGATLNTAGDAARSAVRNDQSAQMTQNTLDARLEASAGNYDKAADLLAQNADIQKKIDEQNPGTVASALYGSADIATNTGAKDVEKAQEGLGVGGRLAVGALSAGTQMLGDMALASVAGVSTLAPMVIRSYGMGSQQARLSGATEQEQAANGLAVAATEYFTEKLFGGNPVYDTDVGLVNKLVGAITHNEKLLKVLTSIPADILSEGLEEVIADVLEPLAQKIIYDPNASIGTLSQIIEDGAVGMLLSALGLSGNAIATAGSSKAGTSTQEVQKPLEAPAQTEQAKSPTTPQEAPGEALAPGSVVTAPTAPNAPTQSLNPGTGETNVSPADVNVPSLEARVEAFNKRNEAYNAQINEARRGAVELTDEAFGALKAESDALSAEYTAIQQAVREKNHELSANYGAEENHIDRRTAGDVSARNVKAFQFDHPQLHQYFVGAAQALKDEAEYSLEHRTSRSGHGTIVSKSRIVERAMNWGLSANQIIKCCDDIISNNGQENYADAKRVEILLDEMLSDGFQGKVTNNRPASQEYIAAKEQIPGAIKEGSWEKYQADNMLSLADGTVTEEQLRAEWEAQSKPQPAVNAVGATSNQPASFSAMQNQTAESGFHPINEKAVAVTTVERGRAPTEVPLLNFEQRLTSKTASTLLNANITSNDVAAALERDLAAGNMSRIAYTDAAAVAKVEEHIKSAGGWEAALGEYTAAVRSGVSSKDITALGITLYNNAVNSGNVGAAVDVATLMVENAKQTAQALQVMNMINKMTPTSRLYAAMRSIDNIREQLIQTYGDKAHNLQIDDSLMQEYYDALKSGDKEAEKSAWHNIQQNIADQIPSNWKDKLNAWRYLSMLGNPRTHIRNIVGNAGFVPVRAMKNIIATSIESAFSVGGRTKAFLNYASSSDRALVNLAASDFKNMEEYIQSGGKYVDTNSSIEDMRTIFDFKPLEWIRKINTAGLNKEDVLFSKPIYAAALASYWKANGITAQDITAGNVSSETMSAAQLYAAKEASKATYRDSNWFSDYVSKLGKNYQGKNPIAKAANVLVEGVLPFKRTPANILARAVEYSIAGLAKGIYDMTVNIKSGKVTAAEAIDTFSAGFTGTGLMVLGAILAAHGLVSGSADDDEKQSAFDKLRGSQNYSITIGNKNYTLDWLAPEALPFFVGVEAFNHFIDNGASKNWQEFTKSLTGITEPLLETSMLSSLEELFSSIKYADGDYLGIAAKTAATSYLSQFMPTIFGQAERAFTENQREETYRYGESGVLNSSGQYSLGNLFNKLPGVDYNQIPYVNAWGERTDGGNLFERIVNNFLNPSYVAKTSGSQTDVELQRLYDLGFNTVLPERAEQSKQIRLYDSDGNVTEKTHMTADEYVAFNEKAGKLSQSYIGSLVLSDFYKGLSDDEKADMIERVYDYANQIATREMAQGRGANYPVDTWVSNAMRSENPLHYIEMYGMYGDTIYTDGYAALVQGGMTEEQAGSLYQSVSDDLDGDSTNAGIFSAVTSQNLSDDKVDVALQAYLEEPAYEKYQVARGAGITPKSYADYYRIQSGYGTSRDDVYAAMNHTDWTPEQKATVWATYGWKTDYETWAASH